MDKGVWRTLIEDDYRVPQQSSPSALLTALLTNLGSSDTELREDACAILGQWIEVQSLFHYCGERRRRDTRGESGKEGTRAFC